MAAMLSSPGSQSEGEAGGMIIRGRAAVAAFVEHRRVACLMKIKNGREEGDLVDEIGCLGLMGLIDERDA